LGILRTHLVKHSPMYERARMTVRYDNERKYLVLLTGEGSHYCLNVERDHSSNHVYMVVRQGKNKKHHSEMRCWCSKPDSVGKSGVTCAKYDLSRRDLSQDEVDHLFKHMAKGPKTKLLHLQNELLEIQKAKARK
jgi:hypothetical protein